MPHVFNYQESKFEQVHTFKVLVQNRKSIKKRQRNSEYCKFLRQLEAADEGKKETKLQPELCANAPAVSTGCSLGRVDFASCFHRTALVEESIPSEEKLEGSECRGNCRIEASDVCSGAENQEIIKVASPCRRKSKADDASEASPSARDRCGMLDGASQLTFTLSCAEQVENTETIQALSPSRSNVRAEDATDARPSVLDQVAMFDDTPRRTSVSCNDDQVEDNYSPLFSPCRSDGPFRSDGTDDNEIAARPSVEDRRSMFDCSIQVLGMTVHAEQVPLLPPPLVTPREADASGAAPPLVSPSLAAASSVRRASWQPAPPEPDRPQVKRLSWQFTEESRVLAGPADASGAKPVISPSRAAAAEARRASGQLSSGMFAPTKRSS